MLKAQIVSPNWQRVCTIFWALFDLVLLVIVLLCTAACGTRQCKRVPITITSHPVKPKPAGRVTVGCDDKVVTDILADEVLP